MYKIKNKVVTTKSEERKNLKRNASVVIYSELIRYIELKREKEGKIT